MPKSAEIAQSVAARRNNPRVRLRIPAFVQFTSGPVECYLDDLSQRGARISLIKPAERAWTAETVCVLQACGIEAFAKVVWASKIKCGLLFDERMPLKDVVAVRHFNDEQAQAMQRRQAGRNFTRIRTVA